VPSTSHWEETPGKTEDTGDYVSWSPGWPERLGVPPEELEEVAREREVWASLDCCPRDPAPDKRKKDGWKLKT